MADTYLGSLLDPIDLLWVLLHLQLEGFYKGFGDNVLATPIVNYQVVDLLVDCVTSLKNVNVVSLHRLLLLLRC
jgi:hypothetical protein